MRRCMDVFKFNIHCIKIGQSEIRSRDQNQCFISFPCFCHNILMDSTQAAKYYRLAIKRDPKQVQVLKHVKGLSGSCHRLLGRSKEFNQHNKSSASVKTCSRSNSKSVKRRTDQIIEIKYSKVEMTLKLQLNS
eukprot:279501_1